MASRSDVDIETQESEEDEDEIPEALEAELVPIMHYDCSVCRELAEIAMVVCMIVVCVLLVLFMPLTIWHYLSKWFPETET